MLTKAQRTAYLRKKGAACPYCESNQIEGGDLDFEADKIAQECRCLDCDQRWVDLYKLVDVIEE